VEWGNNSAIYLKSTKALKNKSQGSIIVETAGIEPASGQEAGRTSTCVASRLFLTALGSKASLPTASPAKSTHHNPGNSGECPVFSDAHL